MDGISLLHHIAPCLFVPMNEIALPWERFAFAAESQWGIVLLAFLRSAYERSRSMHTLKHYRQMLTEFFSSPAKLPDRYDRNDVEHYIHSPGHESGRVGNPVGPGLINNRLSCLSSLDRK